MPKSQHRCTQAPGTLAEEHRVWYDGHVGMVGEPLKSDREVSDDSSHNVLNTS